MLEEHDLSPRQAGRVLKDVNRLTVSTRRAWGAPWFPMVCFGAVTVIAAAALAVLGSIGLIATWVLAGAAALRLTRRHYRRRGHRTGLAGRNATASRWSAGAFVVCFIAAAVGGSADAREGGVLASIAVVLVCYVAFGFWQRRTNGPLAIGAATVPALTLAALSAAPWLVELGFGAGLMVAGGLMRERTRRS